MQKQNQKKSGMKSPGEDNAKIGQLTQLTVKSEQILDTEIFFF